MRTFLGFGQVAYIGAPFAQAIKLGGISGQAIPLLFQWISYGASTVKQNINVLVDLNGKACAPLDQVRSVYIDNLGSDNPIYVNFPDTNYTVVAKPNSEGWYPAYTNARTCWVIGEGFLSGSIPQSFIILSNIFMPPAVNVEIDNAVSLWKASSIITRGNTIYNTNFGVPALGDQVITPSLNCQGPVGGSIPNLFKTPFSSGFVYLNAISVHAMNIQNSGVFQIAQVIESTGISGILYIFQFSGAAGASYVNSDLMTLSGLQLKLDATQQYRIRLAGGPIDSGYFQYYLHFTTNPN